MLFIGTILSCKALLMVLLTLITAAIVGTFGMCQYGISKDDFCEVTALLIEKYINEAKATVLEWVKGE